MAQLVERPRAGNGEALRLREQPTGELIRELLAEGQRLVHEESELVKEDIKSQARSVATGGGLAVWGAVLAVTGVLLLSFALVFALALAMPLWLSALLVGVAFAVVGALIVRSGVNKAKEIKPEETMRELKEDKRWASETMHKMQSTRASA